MSSFSIGKNEIKELEEQEKKLENKLKTRPKSYNGNIFNFQEIALKKEQQKLHNKIAILKHMDPSDDSDDGGIA